MLEEFGLNVELRFQPADCPDFNVLVLGFFRAIQAVQQKKQVTQNIDELISEVEEPFV